MDSYLIFAPPIFQAPRKTPRKHKIVAFEGEGIWIDRYQTYVRRRNRISAPSPDQLPDYKDLQRLLRLVIRHREANDFKRPSFIIPSSELQHPRQLGMHGQDLIKGLTRWANVKIEVDFKIGYGSDTLAKVAFRVLSFRKLIHPDRCDAYDIAITWDPVFFEVVRGNYREKFVHDLIRKNHVRRRLREQGLPNNWPMELPRAEVDRRRWITWF